MTCRICLIEDDEIIGEALTERLEVEGMACDWFKEGLSAIQALKQRKYCLAVSDINLPDMTGEALFTALQDKGIGLPPFLFITGFGSIDQAVRLLKMGAEDYLTKPFDVAELIEKVRGRCRYVALGAPGAPRLGVSAEMKTIEAALSKLSESASTVLITGESGVGKEYVARALHQDHEAGTTLPFVAVNCGAIPEQLLEAELFGHEKGAFTGAVREKRGLFEQAHGGTLFLDEIGDMPLAMQVKLLRAIQERRIQRVGSERGIDVDIRLICATHRDLDQMVRDGEFREDLFYRINVVNIQIPPLRERKDDILWYARDFLRQFAGQKDDRPFTLHSKAEQAMLSYPWPGNIRELRNCIERACVLSPSSVITPEFLFGESWRATLARMSDLGGETLAEYITQCERDYVRQALAENENRIGDTAATLGISRKTLWDKMRKLGLKDET
ncbi:sigma-54-dependent transcriptional regulator [Varunaivibrio sulfuroxidans]|uniref:DNA-binding NtrC family response regulator n=1 Tax=Varunaivibrio sulfuroxidans TaxID=1773489 RepID=A0A4R3J5M3_9PROT|nr:sigma-54 dependent transcriptional regulator [Varunaivibrio sulfuroxidans]TCS60554.1 DNA-binding NtrC family response regulator [Varunaivibrio sulfuroxidans]WES30044.1 sigma-54 dependent transcriptional regulator [Varunaivibrio sulfuroxidans]